MEFWYTSRLKRRSVSLSVSTPFHVRDGIDLKKSIVFEIECEIGDHTATQIAIFADARGQQGVGLSAALDAQ